MNRVQIKVCGITSSRQARDILQCGVDRIGLVLYPQSSRYVTPDRAVAIAESLADCRRLVLVVVNEALDNLFDTYRRIACQTCRIQLHGNESIKYINELRNRCRILNIPVPEIMRRVSTLKERDHFMGVVDKLLWEAPGIMPGGNGVLHGWPDRNYFVPPDKFAIAGGLNSHNVLASIQATGVFEIDVSGGVETLPGIKSLGKVAEFVTVVREYEKEQLFISGE